MRFASLSTVAATTMVLATVPAFASNLVVKPGQSIQAAVDRALPGDVVLVQPGTYHEAGRTCPTDASSTCAVVVTQDNVRLVGVQQNGSKPVLEATPQQVHGIAVARQGADPGTCIGDPSQRVAGSGVSGFVVKGFPMQGISLVCVDDFEIAGNTAINNLEYGIFPSHCAHGDVTGNFATGANDTGIYVGQSSDVRIHGNVAQANVSGYEIENSTDIVLEQNMSTGNTAGILSFTLPFLDVKVNRNNRIANNVVVGNNKPNTCLEPGDDVCLVPPGTGILLVATDDNVVQQNAVSGNNSFGIGVVNFCASQHLPADACSSLDIQPDPDGNRVTGNVVVGNGQAPSPLVDPALAVDLAWDGSGTGNCWTGNVSQTRFPDPLPTCP